MKNLILARVIALFLCVAMLTSCATTPEGASSVSGNVVSSLASFAGADPGTAQLAGMAAAGITYVITKSYEMDRQQRWEAEQQAKRIAQSPKAKKHRYVAVPVKKRTRKAGQPKSDLAVVDTKSGEVVNNKAYETTSSNQLQEGANVKVGGYDAYVFQSL
ncbi:MAG: hypothetical protein ACAI35_25320 [Candidatus Methylacidiphilales bacterium]